MIKPSVTSAGVVVLALVIGLVVSAQAAPVSGPGISAPRTCIRYGSAFTVAGGGYTPDIQLTITAPVDHFVSAEGGYSFVGDHSVVTTDATGAFKLRMRPPAALTGVAVPRFQPRTLLVSASDGAASTAFILIGTRTVCTYLNKAPVGAG